MELIWDDPPEKTNPMWGRMAARLAPLREHPGKWARVHGPVARGPAQTMASRIRRARVVGVKPDEFETRHAELDGEWFVWARYVGST